MSSATQAEKNHLDNILPKLKTLTEYFSEKYNLAYGPFEISVTSGNAIAMGGTKFKRVWAGLFKGAPNKQYAAQISFVMNPRDICLDVGFYFGGAAGRSINATERRELEAQLNSLGISLSDAIIGNPDIQTKYNSLFDYGFKAHSNGSPASSEVWYNEIRTVTKSAHIIAKITPNDFGIIENSTIDFFVSQVIFLMSAIPAPNTQPTPIVIKPMTPEQRAKQAERFAQIGLKGELYIMENERTKLRELGISRTNYPRHVASESNNFGYDVKSLDENGNDLLIEVKTTTRTREDLFSRSFFISNNELSVFKDNTQNYKIYRVYDVENAPSFEILELDKLTTKADGYIVEY